MISLYQIIYPKINNRVLSRLIITIGALFFTLGFFVYGVLQTLKPEKKEDKEKK